MNYSVNRLKKLSVTEILIIINVIVFMIMYAPFLNLKSTFYNSFASSGIISFNARLETYVTVFQEGNFYRLLSANFLHGGPIHLLMNMMGLYILGAPTESMIGKKKFALMYFLSALGTTLLCAFVNICYNPYEFQVVVGASGAVLGIGGCLAGIALYRKFNNIYHMFQIDYKPLLIMLGLNVVIGLLPGISLTGHIGGILTGLVVGAIYAHLIDRKKLNNF